MKVAELTGLLRDGATLTIDRIDELHAPIAELCQTLERQLDVVRVNANMYASWRETVGLGLHWDPHDVIALQVIGTKR